MWLVNKHLHGLEPDREPVPADLLGALMRWYVGEGSEADEKIGVQLIRHAKTFELWFACDCLGAAEKPPLLSPAYLSMASTYYLRRLTGEGRPEHLVDCPFYRDQADYVRERQLHEPRALTPPDGLFAVLKPVGEHLAQQPVDDADDNRLRRPSVPRLARLIWQLIERGNTNIIEPVGQRPKPSIGVEFGKLREAATDLWIAPGVPLRRLLFTHVDDLRKKRIYARLREAATTWPENHAPQAFLLLFAHRVTRREIFVDDDEPILVATDIQKPPARQIDQGPYLVMVAIGDHPQARGFAPVRAYAQPIHDGHHFAAVDHVAERRMLALLLDLQWRLRERQIDLRIKKPVFDIETELGHCRPGFLLDIIDHQRGHRATRILESVGRNDEGDGVDAVMLSRLREIAPVIDIAASELDDIEAVRTRLWGLLTALE
jgi:hypothetical protein